MTTSLTFGGSGTAAATAALAFDLLVSPPTLINTSGNSLVRTPVRDATASPGNDRRSLSGTSVATTFAPLSVQWFGEVTERQTNQVEKAVGELRRWLTLAPDWDGEGAAAPIARSIESASDFIRLLPENVADAEPMLHANGHAGLFWNENGHYADLEFLGDGRIAYFIQHHEDKHKGLVRFNSELVPPALSALLETARVS
jgi:hypothetical protein